MIDLNCSTIFNLPCCFVCVVSSLPYVLSVRISLSFSSNASDCQETVISEIAHCVLTAALNSASSIMYNLVVNIILHNAQYY